MQFKLFSYLLSFLKRISIFKNFAKPLHQQPDSIQKTAPVSVSYAELARETRKIKVKGEVSQFVDLTPTYNFNDPVGKLQAEAKGEVYVAETPVVTLPKVAVVAKKPTIAVESPKVIEEIIVKPAEPVQEMPAVPVEVAVVEEIIAVTTEPEPVKEVVEKKVKRKTRKVAKKTSTTKKTTKKTATKTKATKKTKTTRAKTRKTGGVPLEARGFGF